MLYSDAYRATYNCANSNNFTINREASRLKNNPKITTRIKEIQQSIESKVIEDKTWIIMQLSEIIETYKLTNKRASDAIKAIDLLCKIMGWYHQPEKPKSQINSMVILYDPHDIDNNKQLTMRGKENGI